MNKKFLFLLFCLSCSLFILSACNNNSPNELIDAQGLEYMRYQEDTFGVIGYTGSNEYVTIPETYNGLKVVYIASTAFKNNTKIKGITIPEGIERIISDTFSGCSSLQSLTIPSTVTDYELCICGCSSLVELTFSYAYNSFNIHHNEPCRDIDNLKKISVPLDFSCGGIKFPNSVEEVVLTEHSGRDVTLNHATVSNSVVPNVKKVVITDVIDTLGSMPETLESIEGLEYIETINAEAFKDCINLKELIIPESVKSIKSKAFEGCTGLKEIVVPDSVTYFGENIFAGCSNLESVVFSNNSPLSPGVLKGCTSIKNITLPYAGKYISFLNGEINKEFDDSIGLLFDNTSDFSSKEEALENGFHEFSYLYDEGYSSLSSKGRYFPLELIDNTICVTVTKGVCPGAFSGDIPLGKVVILDDVTEIGELAFRETGVREVILPNGLEEISSEMFKESKGLQTIVIPDSVKNIGDSAFYLCSNLSDVTLNDGLETIGKEAFRRCENLHFINIPSSVHTVSKLAFCNTKLTTITGGDGLVDVGELAFEYEFIEETVYGNVRYKFLQALGPVSNDVMWVRLKPCSTVVSQAFKDCLNLNTVYIGKNSVLNDELFLNGNVLLRVIFEKNQPTTSSNWRIMLNQNGTKYYLGNSYTINGVANTKLGSITENVDITEDGYLYKSGEILGYVGGDTELVLPSIVNDNAVKRVGNNAFLARTDIKKVTINNIEQITSMSFAYCTGLEEVILSGVDSISDSSFLYCTSLNNVTLGDAMRVIGVGAFMNCTSLKSIVIPASVQTIQGSAFYGSGLLNASFDSMNLHWYLIGGSSQTEIIEEFNLSQSDTAANLLVDENNLYFVFASKNIFE